MTTAAARKRTATKTKARPKERPVLRDDSQPAHVRGVALARRATRVPDTLARVVDASVVTTEGSTRSIFNEDQQNIITAPPKDHEIDIKPTGEVYMPWVFASKRLTKAFGAGGWRMVPIGEPKPVGSNIVQEWELWIGDFLIGRSMGWGPYFPNNPRLNPGDAIESAKSRAMRRICKGISLADNCMSDKTWCRAWRNAHCVAVLTREKKWQKGGGSATRNFLRWRKRDADKLPGEQRLASEVEIAQYTGDPIDDADGFEPAQPKSQATPPTTAATTTAPARRDAAEFVAPTDPNEPQVLLHVEQVQGRYWRATAQHAKGRAQYVTDDRSFYVEIERLIKSQQQVQIRWTKTERGNLEIVSILPLNS